MGKQHRRNWLSAHGRPTMEVASYLSYEMAPKMFVKISAKKMAGGRGEKPPCRVRLLKRRRYVWVIKNNVYTHNTSSKKYCSKLFLVIFRYFCEAGNDFNSLMECMEGQNVITIAK
jgi:hypothetical protein